MYEIIQGERRREGEDIDIPTFRREIWDANILEVEAGSTGLKGGDSGHGARHYFRIEDTASTDITVNVIDGGNGWTKGFEVFLGGDTELNTTITALEFILKALKDARDNVID